MLNFLFFTSVNNHFAKAGNTVIETNRLIVTATEIATAISLNNCPASKCIIKIGTNTSTVVKAETITAVHTCCAPI